MDGTMEAVTTPREVRNLGVRLREYAGLCSSAVGVKLLLEGRGRPPRAERLGRHRYCQALMLARRGKEVVLDAEGMACPAAAAAFGLRSLPVSLGNGKGLVGFGIVSDPAVGRRMLEGMTRLEPGVLRYLHLCLLEQAASEPDVVVVEDQVERLMWIALAYLQIRGGERVASSTAVLQATCVDSTIIPYVERRLNLSYGCYGCREATDLAPGEAVLGFPAESLEGVVAHLEYLSQKAIPASRAKGAWAALQAGG